MRLKCIKKIIYVYFLYFTFSILPESSVLALEKISFVLTTTTEFLC